MGKKVFYNEEARQKVLSGAKILYEAVKTTLGPKGRNVVIGKSFGVPTVTKDGVTVARSIDIKDVDDETLGFRVGVELIKQAATKLNDKAGDGTTTVTVLTYHILNEANKLIAAGHDPMELKRGLDMASSLVIKELEQLSEEITDDSKLVEVATISATDAEIGKLIADVIGKIGKDGVVTVEAGQGLEVESELVKGFTFDRGFISAYMVTDTTRMEAVLNNPAIVITDKKISNFQDIMPVLERVVKTTKEVLLIADDVDGEALGSIVLNKIKGVINIVAVKAPGFGDRRKELLQDLAIVTGTEVVSSETGVNFEDLLVTGSAKKIIVTKDETTIVDGVGDKSKVGERMQQIEEQIKLAKSDYDKENLQKRLASLSNKVAVIRVGGATEAEIEEKKFRVDDAVAAVKASLSGGIVAGGGVTLVHIANKLKEQNLGVGGDLLVSALYEPFRTLLSNSGINPDKWVDTVANAPYGSGINVTEPNKVVDMLSSGIIDPAKVTKEVVINAVSVAGTAITTGALVVEIPEEQPQQMPIM